jgi:BirA family biotin operon repressor/biotin-[acetyl-CoA-carboxylase] ligase
MSLQFKISKSDFTTSTNDDAKAAALMGAAEGLVIQAERQSAGRGRQGRAWDSPAGNLYCSILLRPACDVQQAGHYSFIAALAVRAALAELLPQASLQLKWPNDILVNGKKISGILLESAPPENGQIAWLVAGIGINCRYYPESAPYPVSSLKAEGSPVTEPDAVLAALLAQLEGWLASYRQHGFGPIRAAWLTHARRGAITARLPNRVYEGEFSDLDPYGRLIIRLANGEEQAIAAADVFFPATLS